MESGKQLLMKQKDNLEKGKKGLLSVIFGRSGIIFLMVILQIIFLMVGFHFLQEYVFAAYWGTSLLALILVVYIINKPGNPAFQIAWILPILVFPVFGALFYVYFNAQIDTKALNRRIVAENAATASFVSQKKEALEHLEKESMQTANLASYLRKTSGSAVHEQTKVQYFPSGEAVLDTLLSELQEAKKFIFLEFFIISPGFMWDSILEILKVKAKEGVEVRVLYDGMCDLFQFPKGYPKELEKEGIKCRVFSPIIPALSTVQNNRDHRKIVVIDGHTAFTGGINLADEYINKKERFGYWKDSAIMFKGDAVRSFTMMFLRMWVVIGKKEKGPAYGKYLDVAMPKLDASQCSGYVIPYGDNPLDSDHVGESVYMDILNTAEKYVHIMTPYLVLDHEMVVALSYAAKRGVDVKIIMPHIPDKKYAFILARSYYNELLDAGVQIYEFKPGFVHSKVMVSDDCKAVVGSINMDYRSLYLSFECAAFLYGNEAIGDIEKDVQATLKKCITVTKATYQKQMPWVKLAGKVMRLLAPLV